MDGEISGGPFLIPKAINSMQMLLVPAILFALCCSFVVADEPRPTNRLSKESSPYLLQHAHNPVDWYPWGSEALERAKNENKLIFLSVGYSACHWCHVMERESFLDKEIAAFLNEHFVCIKVDREERPDIDQIYMTAIQVMAGRGGWPMSVFLTPDTNPIFGGTYFPARDGDRGASTGFLSVIRRAHELWNSDSVGLKAQADRVTEAVVAKMSGSKIPLAPANVEAEIKELQRISMKTFHDLAEEFDPTFGGFSFVEANPDRPKFPEPSNLFYLLHRAQSTSLSQEDKSLAMKMLRKTLDSMIAGGIVDHFGGGFHRYSTDRFWRIPHFEKMLYDNGQLAQVFAKAFELTDQEEYRFVAEGICDFVVRELKAPGGAFFASLDADSEGEEGKFYCWSRAELDDAAKKIDGFSKLAEIYGLSRTPNFEGRLYAPQPEKTLTEWAQLQKQTFVQMVASVSPARQAMLDIRSKRVRPATDEKILTSWNGLMIAGLADAGRIFKRPDYIAAATDAATFVLKNLKTKEGRLLRSYAAGQAKLNGYLDDYAFLIYGLLSLHEATSDARWMNRSVELMAKQTADFGDPSTGVFYYTSSDHPELIVRFHDPVDGAIPSGNSVTAANLAYLAFVVQRSEYLDPLCSTIRSSVPLLSKNATACPLMTTQIDRRLEHPSPR